MLVLTAIRNVLVAAITLALFWFAARWATPLLAPHLPGQEGLSAVLGLACLLIPIVYKLLDEPLAAANVGGRALARAHAVSVLAGGAVLGLLSGAGVFALTWLLQQSAEIARGAPAAESLVRSGVLHLNWLKFVVELIGALFIGNWIGRRHGRTAILTVLGFALLGWALALAMDILSGLRSAADVHAALLALAPPKDMAAMRSAGRAAEMALLAGALVLGLLGAAASGSRRPATGAGGRGRMLVLGADG